MHGFGRGDPPVNGAEAAVKATPPAMEVDVATVVSKTITDYQSYSGRLEAVDKVDIRPLVPGTIVAVHFADGALVKKGDRSLRSTRVRMWRKSIARARNSRRPRRATVTQRRTPRVPSAC